MTMARQISLVVSLVACGATELGDVDIDIGNPEVTSPGETTIEAPPAEDSAVDTMQEEEPADTEVPEEPDRCDALPPLPTTWTELPFVPASEEFAFDASGHLVNVGDSLNTLSLTTRTGDVEVVTTYTSFDLAGIAVMLNGDVVICNEAEGIVMRIAMDGTREPLATGVRSPNSVTVGADGHVFVTAYDEIIEVDPDTGEVYTLLTLRGRDLDGLAFDPSFRTLYFNHDSGGTVAKLDWVSPGVISGSSVVTTVPGRRGELDGATMDECGNLYVTSTGGMVHRILTDGTVEDFVTLPASANTTSVHFGSGLGGWEDDHIYVMNRRGGVFEVPVGIRGRPDAHLPPLSP